MDADTEKSHENEHAAPPAERRSGIERRMSAGRRRGESGGATPDAPAASPVTEPKGVRKYHFRSFEDRRGGIDRRAGDHLSGSCRSPSGTDEERLTTDDVAGRPRPKG